MTRNEIEEAVEKIEQQTGRIRGALTEGDQSNLDILDLRLSIIIVVASGLREKVEMNHETIQVD